METLPQLKPTISVLARNDTNGSNVCDESPNGNIMQAMMQPNAGLNTLDIICTVFFTIELIVRFIFAPEKIRFIKSMMNIIDCLALVPLYMQLVFNSIDLGLCYANERLIIEVMFLLRIIRMFRIFHLVKHYQALKILIYALRASVQELLMLAIFLLIGMLIFASLLYYAERKDAINPSDSINTIPVGFWWSIITMTTVGYGDIHPETPLGYVIGVACAVSGVLMIALTIPVISMNFTLFYTHVRSRPDSLLTPFHQSVKNVFMKKSKPPKDSKSKLISKIDESEMFSSSESIGPRDQGSYKYLPDRLIPKHPTMETISETESVSDADMYDSEHGNKTHSLFTLSDDSLGNYKETPL